MCHEYGNLCLNGRTIKNILRTATANAQGKNADQQLSARHVYAILQTELQAGDYVEDEGGQWIRVEATLRKIEELTGSQ
ncbi:hypothetical protein N7488_002992 [Penicillium malachiteum]|nr:hypothetical protein N7488_002992 [Penicillium malachiteum]